MMVGDIKMLATSKNVEHCRFGAVTMFRLLREHSGDKEKAEAGDAPVQSYSAMQRSCALLEIRQRCR